MTAKSPKAVRGFNAAPFDGTAIVMQAQVHERPAQPKTSADRAEPKTSGIELHWSHFDPAPRIIFANFLHGPVLSAEILPFPFKGVPPRSQEAVLPRGMVACCATAQAQRVTFPGPLTVKFIRKSSALSPQPALTPSRPPDLDGKESVPLGEVCRSGVFCSGAQRAGQACADAVIKLWSGKLNAPSYASEAVPR